MVVFRYESRVADFGHADKTCAKMYMSIADVLN